MKSLLFVLSLLVATAACAQTFDAESGKVGQYLERIRKNTAELTAFFQAMPKGGDLHNHFSGAIYPEEFFEVAVANGFYVDLTSFNIYPTSPDPKNPNIVRIADYPGPVDIRTKLIALWSVKDFWRTIDEPSDDHFFATFGKFGPAVSGYEVQYLKTLKERYITENIQYLETMFIRPNFNRGDPKWQALTAQYDTMLRGIQSHRDEGALRKALDELFGKLQSDLSFGAAAKNHYAMVKSLYDQAALANGQDSMLAIRFLNYAARVVPPTDVFAQLMLSFLSADGDLILGVNIVAPEDNTTSMADYWLHMQFFKYLHSRMPHVKYSLHAGELTLGLVKPEELTWHIRDAVLTAGAHRIGHGVDMAYEEEAYALLDSMKSRGVAIEINLTSNEFILGVKDERHPLKLYYEHGVPITISTDDAGVLRTNHTEQFVLLANRYPFLSYRDIKKFVYNSIDFSFMNASDKAKVRKRLDNSFYQFERKINREAK